MTGLEMVMGMGFLDGALVDEALSAGKKTRPISFRRGLAAACIGIVLIGGVLAELYFTTSENDPGAVAIEAGNEQIELPGTPEHKNVVVIPPEETPERFDQRPPETYLPEQTDPSQPEITALPGLSNDPKLQGAGESEQLNDSQPGMVNVPEQPNNLPPKETTSPEKTQPTPTPQNGESVIPTVPSESVNLDPAGNPVSNDAPEKVPAEESFSLSWHLEDEGIFEVTVRAYQDYLSYRDYDSEYTAMCWEANGFELIAHDSWTNVEGFKLQLSPNQTEGCVAEFVIYIMDGEEVKTTLHFYGVMTDMGFFGSCTSTKDIWISYHQALYNAGAYSYSRYQMILSLIESSAEPILDDPVPDYDVPLPENQNADAYNETSGEVSNEAPHE